MKAFFAHRLISMLILLATNKVVIAGENPADQFFQQFGNRPSVAIASKMLEQPLPFREQELVDDSGKPAPHSTFKAVAFSAVIPGAGQAYNRSWIKAAAFLAIEVGGWIGNRHFNQRGEERTDQFEAFADAHWDAGRYYNWLAITSGTCQSNDLDCLKQYERNTFSHFLPDVKNQTYYENIGKYDQFNAGWDDTQGGARDSANRESYDFMRADANDQYSAARLFASALLFNHVFSALDAAWTTNRYNKKIARSSFGFLRSSDQRLHPALTLRVEW
jgi:hypothetical protein